MCAIDHLPPAWTAATVLRSPPSVSLPAIYHTRAREFIQRTLTSLSDPSNSNSHSQVTRSNLLSPAKVLWVLPQESHLPWGRSVIIIIVYECGQSTWRSEDNCEELVPSFTVSPGLLVGTHGKCFHLLLCHHLTTSHISRCKPQLCVTALISVSLLLLKSSSL